MSGVEERIMELIRQLREEIRINDQRIKQISGGSGIGIDLTDLMLKAIYDKDSDGVVDNAKKIDGRTIYVANRPPESNEGQDGDIWIEYQEGSAGGGSGVWVKVNGNWV